MGEYFSRAASTVAQNAIAGAEIGLSIDLAPIAATPLGGAVVGGIGGAGFSGLTFAGESRSWSEFAERQQSGAVGGAVVGAAVSLAAPAVGAVATAAAAKVPILGEAGQALAGLGRNALGRISGALPKYQPGVLGEAIQGAESRVLSALRPNASSAAPALVAEGGGGGSAGNAAAVKPAIESAPVAAAPAPAPSAGAASPNRGVVWVNESSTAGPRAEAYQRAATGARTDVATRQPQVPALRFDNPNPRGTNAVRFDGLDADGNVLIDRKLSITGRSKQTRDLARMNEALKQNPDQAARIEVPTEAAKRAAEARLRKLGINIPVVVAPE